MAAALVLRDANRLHLSSGAPLRNGADFRIGHVLPARAYHLYTAMFYVLGIVAVYWLVRVGSDLRSRGLAGWRLPLRRCSRLLFCYSRRSDTTALSGFRSVFMS